MKRNICIICTFCLITAGSFAQSAQIVDDILKSQEATFGHAAYLILTASDTISGDTDFKTACTYMQEQAMIPSSVTAETKISFKEYAFLLMKAYGIKGGMLYRIYPCPRYAYRDLCFLSVIQGKTDPSQIISGSQMLQIIGRMDVLKGGAQ